MGCKPGKARVVAMCGSLRATSSNMSLVKYLQSLASDEFTIEVLQIGFLPVFNQDLEKSNPCSTQMYLSVFSNSGSRFVRQTLSYLQLPSTMAPSLESSRTHMTGFLGITLSRVTEGLLSLPKNAVLADLRRNNKCILYDQETDSRCATYGLVP